MREEYEAPEAAVARAGEGRNGHGVGGSSSSGSRASHGLRQMVRAGSAGSIRGSMQAEQQQQVGGFSAMNRTQQRSSCSGKPHWAGNVFGLR